MRFDKPLNLLTALMLYLIVVMPFEGTIITHASDSLKSEISAKDSTPCNQHLIKFEEGQRFEFEVSKPNLIGILTYDIEKILDERIQVQGVLTYQVLTNEEEGSITLEDRPVVIEDSFWIDGETYLSSSHDYMPYLWNAYIKDYITGEGSPDQDEGKDPKCETRFTVGNRVKFDKSALVNPPQIDEISLSFVSGPDELNEFTRLENKTLDRLNKILRKMDIPINLVK